MQNFRFPFHLRGRHFCPRWWRFSCHNSRHEKNPFSLRTCTGKATTSKKRIVLSNSFTAKEPPPPPQDDNCKFRTVSAGDYPNVSTQAWTHDWLFISAEKYTLIKWNSLLTKKSVTKWEKKDTVRVVIKSWSGKAPRPKGGMIWSFRDWKLEMKGRMNADKYPDYFVLFLFPGDWETQGNTHTFYCNVKRISKKHESSAITGALVQSGRRRESSFLCCEKCASTVRTLDRQYVHYACCTLNLKKLETRTLNCLS